MKTLPIDEFEEALEKAYTKCFRQCGKSDLTQKFIERYNSSIAMAIEEELECKSWSKTTMRTTFE